MTFVVNFQRKISRESNPRASRVRCELDRFVRPFSRPCQRRGTRHAPKEKGTRTGSWREYKSTPFLFTKVVFVELKFTVETKIWTCVQGMIFYELTSGCV